MWQYVTLCSAYDESFTASAIEETFIYAGCTEDGHLSEEGLAVWLWQLSGAEDETMLQNVVEDLLEINLKAAAPSVPMERFMASPTPPTTSNPTSPASPPVNPERPAMIQKLFVACDPHRRGVIEGKVICRLLRRLLGEEAGEAQIKANLARQGIQETDVIDMGTFTQWASNTFSGFDHEDFEDAMKDLLATAERASEAPMVCNARVCVCVCVCV